MRSSYVLEDLMKVEPVDGVASGVNRLHPKLIQCLVLFKHGPRHIHKSSVGGLPLLKVLKNVTNHMFSASYRKLRLWDGELLL